MPIARWKDAYGVNVKEIDQQHQQLLQLVDKLHACVEACIDKDDLKNLLVELVEFTRHHFSTEDRLMQTHQYPGFAAHHREHQVLIEHLDRLVIAVSNGQQPTFYSDYDVSTDWAIAHIGEHDKALGAFLNAHDVF
jgi:hemerythrin